jgi:hypothetical protein
MLALCQGNEWSLMYSPVLDDISTFDYYFSLAHLPFVKKTFTFDLFSEFSLFPISACEEVHAS